MLKGLVLQSVPQALFRRGASFISAGYAQKTGFIKTNLPLEFAVLHGNADLCI